MIAVGLLLVMASDFPLGSAASAAVEWPAQKELISKCGGRCWGRGQSPTLQPQGTPPLLLPAHTPSGVLLTMKYRHELGA